METIADPLEFQRRCRAAFGLGPGLGLVPTMGALHAGHLELVRTSRRRDAMTVVSIFVNPTQFGPNEDFERYPRPLERDTELLQAEGVQLLFTPPAAAIYPPGEATRVEVEGLSSRLDGASRPGHFRGVATVVMKLVQLAQPARLYLGQKDAAQVAVLRRMLVDLFSPVEVVVCPIVREADGVAMSSRNAYLSSAEREAARTLSASLRALGAAYDLGGRDAAALLRVARAVLDAEFRLRLDYLAAVDGATLLPVERAAPGTLFAVAAYAGVTRLIDNAHIASDRRFTL